MACHCPAVSVIIPVYNSATVLPRAVASVLGQTFDDWELLLIDDGSRDNSPAVIAACAAGDARIRTASQGRNSGAAAARNRGLEMARGRFVAFLDADDEWLPTKLERQVALMLDAGAALGFTGFWRAQGGTQTRVRVPPAVTRNELLRGNVIGCLTAMYDRDKLGPMPMPDLRLSHDFALWLDILGRIDHAVGLDEPLAIYHRSAASLSGSRVRSLYGTWRMFRSHIGLSRLQATTLVVSHALRRARQGL